jgi:tRNA nucleotidyltransferase/poly(A) polymerase
LKTSAPRRLKAVGEPGERFAEDALRMMRAVRLAAELDFTIDSETMQGIFANRERLGQIAIERISTEFQKLVLSATPMQGIGFLEKLGLLPYVSTGN